MINYVCFSSYLVVRTPFPLTQKRSTEEGRPDRLGAFERDPCCVSRVACGQVFSLARVYEIIRRVSLARHHNKVCVSHVPARTTRVSLRRPQCSPKVRFLCIEIVLDVLLEECQ